MFFILSIKKNCLSTHTNLVEKKKASFVVA